MDTAIEILSPGADQNLLPVAGSCIDFSDLSSMLLNGYLYTISGAC